MSAGVASRKREPYAEPETEAGAGAGVAVAFPVAGGELNYKCKHNAPWNSNGRN